MGQCFFPAHLRWLCPQPDHAGDAERPTRGNFRRPAREYRRADQWRARAERIAPARHPSNLPFGFCRVTHLHRRELVQLRLAKIRAIFRHPAGRIISRLARGPAPRLAPRHRPASHHPNRLGIGASRHAPRHSGQHRGKLKISRDQRADPPIAHAA